MKRSSSNGHGLPAASRVWAVAAARTSGLAAACLLGAGCSSADLNALWSSSAMTPGSTSGSPDAGPLADVTVPTTPFRRGIAFGYNSVADLQALSNNGMAGTSGIGGVTWWQNWADFPDKSLQGADYRTTGLDFVPTIWGATSLMNAALDANVPPGARYILTFNLPNFPGQGMTAKPQAHLSPTEAANLWPQVVQFAIGRGLKIVSPAVDWCDLGSVCISQSPFDWLDAFLHACTTMSSCQIDFIGVTSHRCDFAAFVSDLDTYEGLAQKYFPPAGKPLWITSYGCQDPDAGIEAFMRNSLAFLDQPGSFVYRYAWFTGRSSTAAPYDLLAPEAGQLTALGNLYVQIPSAP